MTPPEAEGRPFPHPEASLAPRVPQTVGGVLYLGVLAATGVGLVMVVLDAWRPGLTVMGCSFLAGAAGRLLVPRDRAGMLGVRRRLVDVVTLLLLGGGLVFLAAVIPDRAAL